MMDARLMPPQRLAGIIADATTRAATNVTGIFRDERMTWTQQGIHAAAWNAVMHDPDVERALQAMKIDGAAEYESTRPADPIVMRPEGDISVPISTMMLMAGRSGDPATIIGVLRQAWMSLAFAGPSEKIDHERAFDDAIDAISRQRTVDPRF